MWGLKLPYEVGEKVLQSIAVLVELQKTLFILGGGRYYLQSVFFVRSRDGFEILVLGVFHQKGFLIFDFFVHLTMYLMTPIAVYGQR